MPDDKTQPDDKSSIPDEKKEERRKPKTPVLTPIDDDVVKGLKPSEQNGMEIWRQASSESPSSIEPLLVGRMYILLKGGQTFEDTEIPGLDDYLKQILKHLPKEFSEKILKDYEKISSVGDKAKFITQFLNNLEEAIKNNNKPLYEKLEQCTHYCRIVTDFAAVSSGLTESSETFNWETRKNEKRTSEQVLTSILNLLNGQNSLDLMERMEILDRLKREFEASLQTSSVAEINKRRTLFLEMGPDLLLACLKGIKNDLKTQKISDELVLDIFHKIDILEKEVLAKIFSGTRAESEKSKNIKKEITEIYAIEAVKEAKEAFEATRNVTKVMTIKELLSNNVKNIKPSNDNTPEFSRLSYMDIPPNLESLLECRTYSRLKGNDEFTNSDVKALDDYLSAILNSFSKQVKESILKMYGAAKTPQDKAKFVAGVVTDLEDAIKINNKDLYKNIQMARNYHYTMMDLGAARVGLLEDEPSNIRFNQKTNNFEKRTNEQVLLDTLNLLKDPKSMDLIGKENILIQLYGMFEAFLSERKDGKNRLQIQDLILGDIGQDLLLENLRSLKSDLINQKIDDKLAFEIFDEIEQLETKVVNELFSGTNKSNPKAVAIRKEIQEIYAVEAIKKAKELWESRDSSKKTSISNKSNTVDKENIENQAGLKLKSKPIDSSMMENQPRLSSDINKRFESVTGAWRAGSTNLISDKKSSTSQWQQSKKNSREIPLASKKSTYTGPRMEVNESNKLIEKLENNYKHSTITNGKLDAHISKNSEKGDRLEVMLDHEVKEKITHSLTGEHQFQITLEPTPPSDLSIRLVAENVAKLNMEFELESEPNLDTVLRIYEASKLNGEKIKINSDDLAKLENDKSSLGDHYRVLKEMPADILKEKHANEPMRKLGEPFQKPDRSKRL